MELYLSRNLKYLRRKLKLSQQELAETLNITRNKVVSYESTSVEPKFSLLIEMSKFFRIRISSLLSTLITDENFEEQRKYYEVNVDKINNLNVDSEEIDMESMTEKVERLHKLALVYKGLKTLYAYKAERGTMNESTMELVSLVDEILTVNRELIEEFYIDKNPAKSLQVLLNDFA